MSEISNISSKFIEESKLSKTISKPKKGGRFSKKKRQDRRNEVYRLHFGLGYSARRISELLEINRNTINVDIKFLYSKLNKNFNEMDTESLIMRQIFRIEDQRTRFLEQLDKAKSFESKIVLEKMIADNDNKLSNMYLKLRNTDKIIYDTSVVTLNEWLKNMKLDVRAVREQSLAKLSKPTHDKVVKLIEEDEIDYDWQGKHKTK